MIEVYIIYKKRAGRYWVDAQPSPPFPGGKWVEWLPELSCLIVHAFISLPKITASSTWMHPSNQPFICVISL